MSQPFRLALAKRIMKDHVLIANGQPHTQTMTRLHFPRFVETGAFRTAPRRPSTRPSRWAIT